MSSTHSYRPFLPSIFPRPDAICYAAGDLSPRPPLPLAPTATMLASGSSSATASSQAARASPIRYARRCGRGKYCGRYAVGAMGGRAITAVEGFMPPLLAGNAPSPSPPREGVASASLRRAGPAPSVPWEGTPSPPWKAKDAAAAGGQRAVAAGGRVIVAEGGLPGKHWFASSPPCRRSRLKIDAS
ncbi:hypothetical protein ACP70R_006573 [Stipagrostis hirtigluma subsp. patula]